MRTRFTLGLFTILLLAAVGVATFGRYRASRARLSRLLSWDLPKTVTIVDYKGFNWDKDPCWYWSLKYTSNDLAPLMAGFSLKDHDEAAAWQRGLEDIFRGQFKVDPLNRVYSNEIQKRDVVILLKPNGTNAYVGAYSQHP